MIRPINDQGIIYFVNLLRHINWLGLYALDVTDAGALVEYFLTVFVDVLNLAFPFVSVKSNGVGRTVKNKWYNNELQNLKNMCLHYYSLYNYHGMSELKGRYIELKKLYKKTLNSTKRRYYSNLISNSNNKSKSTWSIVSSLLNRNNSKYTSADPSLNAEGFNSFFVNAVENIVSVLSGDNNVAMQL